MRPNTLSGSPKKNAARLGSSKYSGGSSEGLVPTCQMTNRPPSRPACHRRSLMALLLRIAFEHLGLHRAPDLGMQLEVARREPDLGHVARPRQVDRIGADRPRLDR